MVDWMMQELRWKAGFHKEKGYIGVFGKSVIKSDTAIPLELETALKEAVAPLENVPAKRKDYHPGSDNTVVDLVHPS
ncbi:hypothetical protein BDV06DRAFT_182616 [Aspergillus oleicola]